MKTVVVAILGFVLLAGGLALLVLPGPGFVLVAAGLAVLATQFSWAKKPLEYAKDKAQQGIEEVAKKPWRTVFAIVCALALVVVGVLVLAGVDLPLLTTITAIFLILSGVALVGTVVYAKVKQRQEAPAR